MKDHVYDSELVPINTLYLVYLHTKWSLLLKAKEHKYLKAVRPYNSIHICTYLALKPEHELQYVVEEHAAIVLKQETGMTDGELKNHIYMTASQEAQEVGIREAAARSEVVVHGAEVREADRTVSESSTR